MLGRYVAAASAPKPSSVSMDIGSGLTALNPVILDWVTTIFLDTVGIILA